MNIKIDIDNGAVLQTYAAVLPLFTLTCDFVNDIILRSKTLRKAGEVKSYQYLAKIQFSELKKALLVGKAYTE